MRDYERLVGDPRTAPHQYLHAGSTDHENYRFEAVPITEAEDHALNDAALERVLPRYLTPALDFFDAFLAGRSDPEAVPRVRWHLPGEGWRDSPSWPPPGASQLELYPTEPGGLAAARPADAAVGWVHDPGDLVPSTITNPFAFLLEYPDENEVAARPDVLDVHRPAAAGAADPRRAGDRPVAVATDGPSLFLHVKLVVVSPDGSAHILLYGQEAVEQPDGGQPATVPLGHTGHRVGAGHSLRLQVASSDYPLYVPHPGTSESPWFAVETAVNHQQLAIGPSRLVLTVLPG